MRGPATRVALLAGAFSFVAFFGTVLPADIPEVRVATHILFGAPLAIWAALRLGRTRTALDGPILVALAVLAVVALASREVQGSLDMLAGATAWALLFWAMADVRASAHRGAIAMGVVGGITAWMAIFAVRWGTEKIEWVTNGGGMPNLFESIQTLFWLTSNAVPVLSLLALGLAFHLPRSPASRGLVGALVVTSVVAVPMSGGRAGWLGLLVAGVASLLFLRPAAMQMSRRTWAAIVSMVAGVAVVAAVALGDRFLDAAGLSSRLPLWGQAVSIFVTDPLTGGGPGTYSWLRLEHVEPYHSTVPAVLAHNVLFQTLADGGILLFVALSAVVGGLGVAVWRRRSAMGLADRGTAAVLLGFVPSCLLDDHSSLPAVTAMVVTLSAWLVVPPATEATATRAVAKDRTGARTGWRRPAMLGALALVLVVALPSSVAVDIARIHAAAGRAAMLAGQFGPAADAFERALGAYPGRANYHLSAGMALALDGRTDEARGSYRTASELAPADARAWGALAALAETSEDRLRFARWAAEAPTPDARYAYDLGVYLAERGDPSAAEAFAHAVARAPETMVALRGDLDAETVAAVADALFSEIAAFSAEGRSEIERLRSDLFLAGVGGPRDLPAAWQAVADLQRGQLDDAELAASRAVQTAPFARWTWHAARVVGLHGCDRDAADRATALLALVPGARVRYPTELVYRVTDLAYRETGLGSYQPVPPPFDPELLRWPDAYLTEPAECDR